MINSNLKQDKSIIFWNCIMALLIAGIALLQLDKAWGVSWGYADEIGYWGTAAMLTGHDWSDFMSNISYYSFVYGLILTPIMLLPFEPGTLYRLAIVLNAVLLVLTYFISYKCAEKLFVKLNRKVLSIVCAAVVLYSSNIFYAQNTNGEILYLLLFWLLLYSCLVFLEKKTLCSAVVSVLLAVLNFAAHMRSLSLFLATLITIFAVCMIEKKFKIILASGITAVVGFGIFQMLKSFFLEIVYMGGEYTKYNDISGQSEKLSNLFSVEGIKTLLSMCLGRVFYLGTSSFLLIYIGVFVCILGTVSALRKRFGKQKNTFWLENIIKFQYWPVMFFLVMSLAFSIGISALYFQNPGEYISFVYYGRYTEYLIGPFLILALIVLLRKIEGKKYLFGAAVILHILICGAVYFYLSENSISRSGIHPNAVGIAGMLTYMGNSAIEHATFGIALEAIVIGAVIFGVLCFCEKRENILGRVYITSFLLIFLWAYNTYGYINNSLHSKSIYNKQQLYLSIAEELDAVRENETVLFPFDGTLNGAGSVDMTYLQYKVPDLKINMISVADAAAEEQILKADWLLWSTSVSYPPKLKEIRDSSFEVVVKNDVLALYKKAVID